MAALVASAAWCGLSGCGADETPSCYQLIETYEACLDAFCAVEGSGTAYCNCWIRGYGTRTDGCACHDTIWLVSARGLCAELGPDQYAEQVTCERGIAHAHRWIDDCG